MSSTSRVEGKRYGFTLLSSTRPSRHALFAESILYRGTSFRKGAVMRHDFARRVLARFRSRARLSTLVFLFGCILIVLLDDTRDTRLQLVTGYLGAFAVQGLFDGDYRPVLTLVITLPALIIYWRCREHVTDPATVLLVTTLLCCSLWAYTRDSNLGMFLPLFVFSLGALPILNAPRNVQVDWQRSLVLVAWTGVLLWSWNFAPEIPFP